MVPVAAVGLQKVVSEITNTGTHLLLVYLIRFSPK